MDYKGFIRKGIGAYSKIIGKYEYGSIYSETGPFYAPYQCVGSYDDYGNIYSGSGWERTRIGKFENGYIYRIGSPWDTPVGQVDRGRIYKGVGNLFLCEPVGEFDGDSDGEDDAAAAAAALLLHMVD